MLLSTVVLLGLLAIPLFTLRLLTLLRPRKPTPRSPSSPIRLLIILGSGGHTAEMLSLLHNLDTAKYHHRSYLISSGDAFSALKAKEYEHGLADTARSLLKLHGSGPAAGHSREPARPGQPGYYGGYDVAIVPRAREIHQSIATTPLSSLWCMVSCFGVLRSPDHRGASAVDESLLPQGTMYPHLIISNGPATAVIAIAASLLLRFFGLPGTQGRMRTIYVESWARVRRLSLSGKILVRVVDRFLVQWEGLVEVTGGKGEYLGVLV